MSKDFHHTIIPFVENSLINHKMVADIKKVEDDSNIFYMIQRIWKSPLKIWLSDAYSFTINDYTNRPDNIDFIYIAKPYATYNKNEVVELALKDGINIGKFWALMGILYVDRSKVKDYIPKERKEEE